MSRHLHHVCLLRPIVVVGVVVLNLAHPLLHSFEGGTLDLLLMQLDLWAMNLTLIPTED